MNLDVNHNTFQAWRYRKREMPCDLYLKEFVLFERMVSAYKRQRPFMEVAQFYYKKLCTLEPATKRRYLKDRGITTVDDYYSHLHIFLTRYHRQGRAAGCQDLYFKKKQEQALNEYELQDKIMKQTTLYFRKLIHDTANRLNSTSPYVIMRELIDYIETREDVTTGINYMLSKNGVNSTGEFVAIIKFVLENPYEFVDMGIDI